MFGRTRQIAHALFGIKAGVHAIAAQLAEARQASPDEGLRERLEMLELSRATWEAELEGLLMKAENQLRSARASEERARVKAKNNGTTEVDEDGFEMEEFARRWQELQGGDADRSEEEGVLPLPEDVDVDTPKQVVTALKFGM